jgi:integrase
MTLLDASTGPRASELTALRWKGVDFDAGILHGMAFISPLHLDLDDREQRKREGDAGTHETRQQQDHPRSLREGGHASEEEGS